MLKNLGESEVQSINELINNNCRDPHNYRELNQLYTLFKPSFASGLEKILNNASSPTTTTTTTTTTIKAEIGWIDKTPVAKADSLKTKTEIGDAIIFAFHEELNSEGMRYTKNARAVILQAKIAKTLKQLSERKVPISSSESTKNQIILLSEWPIFNLFLTGASKEPLLTNVDIPNTSLPPPEAWFIVAPGKEIPSPWPCWWMAGASKEGEECSTPLGKLIVDFLSTPPSTSIGANFNVQDEVEIKISAGWDDLCNKIRNLTKKIPAPPSVFGKIESRNHSLFEANAHTHPSSHLVIDSGINIEIINFPMKSYRINKTKEYENDDKEKGLFTLTITITNRSDA